MVVSVVLAVVTLFASPALTNDAGIYGGSICDDRQRVKSVKIPLREKFGLYYANVWVGNEEQLFSLMVDTGSSVTWLAGERCKHLVPVSEDRTQSFYSDRSKMTYGSAMNKFFGATTFNGTIAKDIFKIGDQQCTLAIDDHRFAVVEDFYSDDGSIEEGTLLDDGDGIMGLALYEDEEAIDNNFFKSILKKTQMAETFGLYLRGFTDASGVAGFLVLGEGDENQVEGTFTSHNVVKVGGEYKGWNVRLNKISVVSPNGTTISVIYNEKTLATIDSACTIIVGPTAIFNQLNSAIFEYVGLAYDITKRYTCKQIHHIYMPNVVFTLDKKDYVLPFQNYIADVGDDVHCRSVLMGVESPDDVKFILGVTFLERFYAKFNMKDHMVDLAMTKLDIPPPA